MEPDRTQSEFNMALSWLGRINFWLWTANEAQQNNDAYGWIKSLLILFNELSTEMKPAEEASKLAELKNIYEAINNQVRTKTSGIDPNIFWALSSQDRWLRKIVDKSGLLKKIKEDPSMALAGGR